MIVYSAPAKVILSGEHAVVYGKPALATAVDMRMYVAIWKRQESIDEYTVQNSLQKKLSSHIPLQNLTERVPQEDVRRVIALVRKHLEAKKTPLIRDESFEFALFSQIPLGRGLGSSAALSVSVVACLLEWLSGKQFDQSIINSLAYKVEKYFHHNPSGIDNSVSCYGGLVYYRKEFEFLKQFSSLNFKLKKELEDNLFLIDSGKPVETTGEMVKIVGAKYNRSPQKMERAFQEMEKRTKRIVLSIAQENDVLFYQSIQENQRLLDDIGIVSSSSRKLIKELAPYGYGKVTGAGGKKKGSGFILFYATKPEELRSYLYKHKISYYKFSQGLEGVRREK